MTANARLRFVLVRIAVLAAALLASPAVAQRADLLRPRDLQDAPPRLADAIAQLRPHWLTEGESATQVRRVVVFVNGRYLGDARVLFTIATAEVLSARVRDPGYVRSTDARFPREEFDVAIYVATRSVAAVPPAGRLTVSVDPGFDILALGPLTENALDRAGFDQARKETERGVTPFNDPAAGGRQPVLGATVHYGVRGPWGVALTGQYTWGVRALGYSPAADTAVTITVSSSEAALLATGTGRAFRVGVGPVYRRLDAAWEGGFCQCREPSENTSTALGVAAEGVVQLPLTAHARPGLRFAARYYPTHKLDYAALPEPLDVRGLVLTLGLSLGVRF